MIRRTRSLIATVIDVAAGPLGWDVWVTATHGLPGIDAWCLVRRLDGAPRPRRLAWPRRHRLTLLGPSRSLLRRG